ncbi:hypothetical protein TNCV_4781231 [Trichonephila clavipes]|nr:hypothetical protein TNCV_4781231 [Trichonephila clavipes]
MSPSVVHSQFFELFGARRCIASKLASLWNCSSAHELLLRSKTLNLIRNCKCTNTFVAHCISGKDNIVADALSRIEEICLPPTNRIQNKIKRKIQAVTQKQWEDKLASLDTVDGSLWSTTKGFKKKRSALKGNTGIAYTDEEKAETLADSLEN